MRFQFLSSGDARRYTTYLAHRYGIPFAVMKDWSWYGHAQSVYVVTHSPFQDKGLNVYASGMLAFTDGKTFAPTSNFISTLGKHISQNKLELSEDLAPSFFARHKLSREGLDEKHIRSHGYVAILLHGQVVASALLTQTHLIPNLPSPEHGSQEG